jgi:uncharacterized membrane protein
MDNSSHSTISKGRLEALNDGIFAIVMTLLALELINANMLAVRTAAELNHTLLALWPKVLSYLISFVVLGVFWVGQHTEHRYLTHTDSRHIWLNLLFLLAISFMPFSAALLGEHYEYQTAVVIYGLNRVAVSMTLYCTWWYATHHRLGALELTPRIIKYIAYRLLFGAAGYLGAVAVSFWSPTVSFFLYAFVDGLTVLVQLLPSVVNPRHVEPRPMPQSEAVG